MFYAALVCAGMVGQPLSVSSQTERSASQYATPSVTAEALIAAIAVHDARLRSLEWRQRVTVRVSDTMPSVVLEESTQGFDDLGYWYLHQKYGVVPDTRDSVTYYELSCRAGDEESRGFQRPGGSMGTVTIPDGFARAVYPTPAILLGRWLDVSCDCPLSEVLRQSPRQEIVKVEGNRVRLRCWRSLNGCACYIDVDCDATREYVPTRIEYFDVLLNTPIMTFETSEFARREGVWIPVRGTKTAWVRTGTDEQFVAMMQEVVNAGYTPPYDPNDLGVQAAHRRAIEKVFGPSGVPVEPMGQWVNALEVTDILSVNQGLNEERARVPFPPNMRLFNSLLDTVENPDGSGKEPVPRYADPASGMGKSRT